MSTVYISGCDLHIPHKEWSGDERERQNYLEMERWANHFRKYCCAGGAGAGGMPPESPPILVVRLSTSTGYCNAGLMPSPTLEDDVRFSTTGVTLITSPISADAPNGPGITVQPYVYTSAYFADYVHWTFPPVSNLHVHLKFTFSETLLTGGAAAQPVTRGLHIWLDDGSGGIHMYQNYVGTRISTVCQLDIGPYDMTTSFTMHCYCLWNSVITTDANSHNVYGGSDGLTVTGEL